MVYAQPIKTTAYSPSMHYVSQCQSHYSTKTVMCQSTNTAKTVKANSQGIWLHGLSTERTSHIRKDTFFPTTKLPHASIKALKTR